MRLIDADAFKEYICNAYEQVKHMYPDGGEWARQITEDFCKDIDEQPTIEPQKWIPVSESKPGFPCIVSDAHGNISTPYGIIGLSDIEHGKWYVDARNDRNEMINGQPASLLCWENRIVAWMPLPEPWKEEE